jgi:hypothetical protein
MVALPIADGLPVVVAFAVLKARTRQAELGLFVTGVKLGSGAGDVDDPQSRRSDDHRVAAFSYFLWLR